MKKRTLLLTLLFIATSTFFIGCSNKEQTNTNNIVITENENTNNQDFNEESNKIEINDNNNETTNDIKEDMENRQFHSGNIELNVDYEVDDKQLINEIKENNLEAIEKYTGKNLAIKGMIDTQFVNLGGKFVVFLEQDHRLLVNCELKDEQVEFVKQLKEDDMVIIYGNCKYVSETGYLIYADGIKIVNN